MRGRELRDVIERSNPIPPGVYWVDLFGAKAIEGFTRWATLHAGVVRVLKVAQSADDAAPLEWYDVASPALALGKLGQWATSSAEPYAWILFELAAPLPRWPEDIGAGLPTVAPRGRDTDPGDTVERPDAAPLFGDLSPFASWGNAIAWGLGAVAVGATVYAVTHRR